MWNLLLLYLQTQNIIYDDLEVIAFYLHFNAKTVIGQDAENNLPIFYTCFVQNTRIKKKKKNQNL